jgi:sugar phosphate permease
LLTFANGLAQGPSWPAAVKILQNWTPKAYFTTAWCLLSTSSNMFGALGSFIFTTFALNYHWSYGLLIPGCLSMTFSYLALLILRNKPSDTGFANFKHVKKDDKKKVNYSNRSPNLCFIAIQLFKYPYFIVLLFITLIVNLVKIIYSDWTQFYLIKVKNMNSLTATWFTSSYEIGGLVSSVVSGIIMDYLLHLKEQNKLSDKNPRVTVLLVYNLIALVSFSLFAHLIHSESSILQLVTIGLFSGFAIYGPTTLLGVMAIEFTSSEISGTSHSIVSLASNIAAILAGYPFSLLTKIYSWNLVFIFIQILLAIGIFCLLLSRNFETKFIFNIKKYD